MSIDIPLPKMGGYVIYNPQTGLFSGGGTRTRWQKKPKIWASMGHLKNHLHCLEWTEYGDKRILWIPNNYKGCIVYDITTMEPVEGFDITEFYRTWYEQKKASSKYLADYVIKERE